MPLEKLSFTEAKRRANERIAEWVAETKAAGIIRLQDRYGDVFKKMDWRAEQSQAPKIGTKLKPTQGQAKNETDKLKEVGQFTHEILPSRMGRRSPNQSRCKSRERSQQTPERCQSSRLTSEKRPESRKRYRDSASLIYGDNRNNRSSLVASVCSDAMSLIQDGVTSEWQNLYQETKINTEINERTRAEVKFLSLKNPTIDYRANKHQSYLPVRKTTKGPTFSPKRTLQKNKDSRRLSIFPKNFQKRKRRIRNWEQEIPYFEIDDGVSSAGTSSGTSEVIGTEAIQNPSLGVSISPPKGLAVGLMPSSCALARNSNQPLTRASSRRFDMSRTGIALTVATGLSRAKSSCLSRRRLIVRSAYKRTSNSSDGSSVSTPERGTPKGKLALRRFRVLVRMIMSVILILRTTVKTVQKNMRSDVKRKKKKTGVLMAFDPSYYNSATTTYGHLSERSRNALQKMPRIRTEADIRVLTEVMSRLPLFTKYSRKVKEELARFVWYDMYEAGRIIIRQGDMGSRMYFVVSGTVSIHRTERDHKTGIKVIQHLRDIEMGSTFGELALIRNISRTYTAVCKVDSEFLSVDKDQFNKVLRQNWEESWQNRYNFLVSSPYFTAWTKEQLHQTADVALTKEYNNNVVVFGNEQKVTNWVYFILKGRCQIVQKLSLVRSKSPYKRSFLTLPGTQKAEETLNTFMNKPYGKRQRQLTLDTHFLTITTLQKGDYFGVGEDMNDCYIVTTTKAEILLLNAASYSIHSKREELESLKNIRNDLLPSFKELHRRFETNRRWWEYKQKIVSEVVHRRSIPNKTCIDDIPETIRESEGIPQCLTKDVNNY